jgi:PAS domain S-box-containing protein
MPDDVLRDLRQTVDALERKLDERDQRTQELVHREAELRASEERYGLVIQAVAEGIYEWDIERNSLRPSARLIEIFGFHGRDLTAADWNELVHPEDFSHYRAALRDCFKAVTARLDCEYRVRHSDGRLSLDRRSCCPGAQRRRPGDSVDRRHHRHQRTQGGRAGLARSLGAADCARRGAADDQFVARRTLPGIRRDARQGDPLVRGGVRHPLDI